MESGVFALGDGDRIRQVVERHLFVGDLEGLRSVSARIASAVQEIKKRAVEEFEADVVVAGGDDVVLRLAGRHVRAGALEDLIDTFRKMTGCTMSFGCGSSIDAAYLNLRRAKAGGGDAVVGSE